jgi:pyruvate formate lyase activating enzyme
MSEGISLNRRQFLTEATILVAGASAMGAPRKKGTLSWKEARYYKKLSNQKVQCELCPWQCVVSPGHRGHCDVRANRDGTYYSLVYGHVATYHNDPIEKKPFYHFLPQSTAFSIATAGCNVDCKFCQNWELAQRKPEELPNYAFTPKEIIRSAKQYACQSVAFTYNEPTVLAEYLYDIAVEGKLQDIRSVIVSNGFINKRPLIDLCKVIDGYKVDLKAFTEKYYEEVVGGRLMPVLDSLVVLKSQGVWTEIVYLMVPTLNDNMDNIRDMSKWILGELGPDVPLHFSRFYPKYKLKNLPPTPIATLEKARNIALDVGLHYIYMGNVPGHEGENTFCPSCHKVLIRRLGYQIFENHIQEGKCSYCGHPIAGFW